MTNPTGVVRGHTRADVVRSIYKAMASRGLVRSEREFSRLWLNRAPNYTCDTAANISVEAALTLYVRLVRAGHRDLATQVWSSVAG